MNDTYTFTPAVSLTNDIVNTWPSNPTIISNGSDVKLDLSEISYIFDGQESDIRIIKAEIIWPTGETEYHYTKLIKNINSWLGAIAPKHIVFDESELINDKNKLIIVNLYDIADNQYILHIPILIESRSILSMNITVDPSYTVYNGNIAATILDIRPESVESPFQEYKTPVLTILT